jgi:flagellar protein FliO/FliZ
VDLLDLSRTLFGLMVVLALIGLCALSARKIGLTAAAAALRRDKRLKIVEALSLDAKRRAVILSCDGREHLLLLGPGGDVVIQTQLVERQPTDEPLSQAFPIAEALRRFKERETSEAA